MIVYDIVNNCKIDLSTWIAQIKEDRMEMRLRERKIEILLSDLIDGDTFPISKVIQFISRFVSLFSLIIITSNDF